MSHRHNATAFHSSIVTFILNCEVGADGLRKTCRVQETTGESKAVAADDVLDRSVALFFFAFFFGGGCFGSSFRPYLSLLDVFDHNNAY